MVSGLYIGGGELGLSTGEISEACPCVKTPILQYRVSFVLLDEKRGNRSKITEGNFPFKTLHIILASIKLYCNSGAKSELCLLVCGGSLFMTN